MFPVTGNTRVRERPRMKGKAGCSKRPDLSPRAPRRPSNPSARERKKLLYSTKRSLRTETAENRSHEVREHVLRKMQQTPSD